jgi:hypothetical protein
LSFSTYDYISHIHYTVIAKKGREILFKEFNKPPAKKVRSAGDENIYEWDLQNVKNIPYDDHVPIWYSKRPFVQISEYKSWKEVVDWGLDFYQVPVISGALKSKVDELKKQFVSSRMKFATWALKPAKIHIGLITPMTFSGSDMAIARIRLFYLVLFSKPMELSATRCW